MTPHVIGYDKKQSWTDWSGRGFRKKSLANSLKEVCPSMRLTERKRIATKLADGDVLDLALEHPSKFSYLFHILEATGIVFSVTEKEPNQSAHPAAAIVDSKIVVPSGVDGLERQATSSTP